MTPGKHQRSKQRCQDLCWKVDDPAQSFARGGLPYETDGDAGRKF